MSSAVLTQIATIQSAARSATTGQFSITIASDNTDAQVRIVPLKGVAVLSALGQIPTREHFEILVDGAHTIAPGYRVVHNSVTYEVLTVQTFGDHNSPSHHQCIARRLGDV